MNSDYGRRYYDSPIRIAIIGAGIMGTNHARVLSTITGARISGITDTNSERASALASAHATEVLSLDSVALHADAAIVATASHTHADITCSLLERGLDVFVEKPIATTVEDAQRIVDMATQTGRTLMVGHVERFNPAASGLAQAIDNPIHFEFTRASAYSSRITSDVVLDLMIHDLDLFRTLSGAGTVNSVTAIGRAVHGTELDIASCLLEADNGITATLTASRAGQNKVRTIEVTQRDNFVTADLLRQDVNIHRVAHSEFVSTNGTRYSQSGVVEIPYLERSGEPLRVELEAFLQAVLGKSEPPVDGLAGLAALELALTVSRMANRVSS